MPSSLNADRRTFLWSALAAGALACKGPQSPTPTPDPGTPTPTTPATPAVRASDWVRILDEAREIVRLSPDHRPATAARLVEAGDPEALFDFVRDEIRLLPGWDNIAYLGIPPGGDRQQDRAGWGTRYGVRGALRAGSGTPMDRAALLASLLREAGFADAEVVEVPANLNDDATVRARFLRDWVRPEPDWTVSEELTAIWEGTLGTLGEPETYAPADPTGAQAEELATALLHLLPADAPDLARDMDWSWGGPTPLVRFTRDGVETFADPHDPHASLGTTTLDTTQATPIEIPDGPTVTVRLEARSPEAIDTPAVLVEGSYLATELLGRQLFLSTLPVAQALDWVTSDRGSVPAYKPALIVQAPDQTETPDDIYGDAFTLAGSRIEVDGDEVRVDGFAVTSGGAAPAASRAATIELEVDASRFPTILARGTILDAAGVVVDGLQADQLGLTDEEVLVSTLVRSNRELPVVDVLIDQSLSMPLAYRGEAGEQWVTDLTAAILDAVPEAVVRPRFTQSDLWNQLTRAAGSGADAIVFLTDGDLNDDSTPEILAALAAGPPAFLVEVDNNVDDAALLEMAAATDGEVLGVEDEEAAIQAIVHALSAIEPHPYVIEWVAPEDAAGTRQVELTVGSAVGTGSYEAIPGVTPNRFVTLELVVDHDGDEVRRVLAGWRGAANLLPTDDAAQLADWAEEVHEAILGVKVLAFEGDRPSLSQILEERIDQSAALAPWLEPPQNDLDAGMAMLEAGLPVTPSMATAAFPELQPAGVSDEMTFVGGLRTVLCHGRVTHEGQSMIVDHLPTGRVRTVLEGDARALFEANLRRTARLAFVEDTLGTATVSLLAGETLVRIDLDTRPELDPVDQQVWREMFATWPRGYRIASTDGSVRAFWWIDRDTGELLGVTPEGAGGAAGILGTIDALKAYFDLLLFWMQASPSLSAAAAYFAELAKLYAAVSTAILGFVTTGLAESVEAAIRKAACEALLSFKLPALGGAVNGLASATLGKGLCDLVDGQPDFQDDD